MMMILFGILMLLNFAICVLALSSIGHLHLKAAGLQAQIAETFHEVQFQARTSRRQFIQYMDERVLPTIGWKPDPPSELEKAMQALAEGREPVIDFGQIRLKGKI
jgi:hypothetical protein